MTALGDRAHILVRPEARDALVHCLAEVLGCGAPAVLNVAGRSEPILAFRFPGGGSISVEVSEDALIGGEVRRGAWLEVRTDDVEALIARVRDAGLDQITHVATPTFYFALPGGQVLGVMPMTRGGR
jgi:hypothetical protein